MLDFTQISDPIHGYAEAHLKGAPKRVAALNEAGVRIEGGAERLDEIRERARRAKTSWLVAEWLERPDTRVPAPTAPRPCVAIGTDGSQIVPDRHDPARCCLINVGLAAIRYGGTERPTLISLARLTDTGDDLAGSVDDEDSVLPRRLAIRRLLDEMAAAVEFVEAESRATPTVALCDGSLILWPLQNETGPFHDNALDELRRTFARARERRVPIVGYISRPGSRDVVNSLRVAVCPHPEANCDRYCPSRSTLAPECAGTEGATDADLFETLLRPGERSASFGSSSKILDDYAVQDRVRFFYLNVGREIARIELPDWAAGDVDLLERAHAICYEQAMKGDGYPVALTEAHELAVVRAPERDLFFQLLEREFVRRGEPVRVSRKAISKRARRV